MPPYKSRRGWAKRFKNQASPSWRQRKEPQGKTRRGLRFLYSLAPPPPPSNDMGCMKVMKSDKAISQAFLVRYPAVARGLEKQDLRNDYIDKDKDRERERERESTKDTQNRLKKEGTIRRYPGKARGDEPITRNIIALVLKPCIRCGPCARGN